MWIFEKSQIFQKKDFSEWSHKYQKDIRNLHLACPACNTQKRDDSEAKFLSPNYYLNGEKWICHNPEDIEDAMFYHGPFLFASDTDKHTEEAKYTIEKLKLNTRPFLVESRLRVYNYACTILETLYVMLNNYNKNIDSAISITFRNLIDLTENHSHYSTMVLHNFGDSIYQLLVVWQKKRL